MSLLLHLHSTKHIIIETSIHVHVWGLICLLCMMIIEVVIIITTCSFKQIKIIMMTLSVCTIMILLIIIISIELVAKWIMIQVVTMMTSSDSAILPVLWNSHGDSLGWVELLLLLLLLFKSSKFFRIFLHLFNAMLNHSMPIVILCRLCVHIIRLCTSISLRVWKHYHWFLFDFLHRFSHDLKLRRI